MRLGYERIIKDKSISLSVEESEDPWVTLKVQGHDEISFKASDCADDVEMQALPENSEIKLIIDTVHQAYINACKSYF